MCCLLLKGGKGEGIERFVVSTRKGHEVDKDKRDIRWCVVALAHRPK
jgi:hypothetical protein